MAADRWPERATGWQCSCAPGRPRHTVRQSCGQSCATWVTDEWQRSDNDAHADLLSRIDAHRTAIATEIAKMLDQIVAPPSAEEPQVETVKVEPSADLEALETDTVVVDPQSE